MSFLVFFLYCYVDHRDLHSFPTRRSSDLGRIRGMYGLPSCTSCAANGTSISQRMPEPTRATADRKSTRLNSSHEWISYAVFCLKKKKKSPHKMAPFE